MGPCLRDSRTAGPASSAAVWKGAEQALDWMRVTPSSVKLRNACRVTLRTALLEGERGSSLGTWGNGRLVQGQVCACGRARVALSGPQLHHPLCPWVPPGRRKGKGGGDVFLLIQTLPGCGFFAPRICEP